MLRRYSMRFCIGYGTVSRVTATEKAYPNRGKGPQMSTGVDHSGHGRHELPEEPDAPQTFGDEFRDAVSLRTIGLILGVLFLQLGFILSYVGAFHSPTPQRIPLGIVASSSQVSGQAAARLNAVPSSPLSA